MQNFDFEHWARLARTSPHEFEVQRRAALQALVDASPLSQQPALVALVDTLCAPQQGSPVERAVNAQTLMLESLGYLKGAWDLLAQETGEGSPIERALLDARIELSSLRLPPSPG